MYLIATSKEYCYQIFNILFLVLVYEHLCCISFKRTVRKCAAYNCHPG